VFLPNREEARALSSMSSPKEAVQFFHEAGAEEVIIKLDKDGCAGYSRDAGYCEQKAIQVEAVDTTAAGEAFNAGVIWGFLRGMSVDQRMLRGNILAGLFISDIKREYPGVEKIEQYAKEI
jgi:ribokinase